MLKHVMKYISTMKPAFTQPPDVPVVNWPNGATVRVQMLRKRFPNLSTLIIGIFEDESKNSLEIFNHITWGTDKNTYKGIYTSHSANSSKSSGWSSWAWGNVFYMTLVLVESIIHFLMKHNPEQIMGLEIELLPDPWGQTPQIIVYPPTTNRSAWL